MSNHRRTIVAHGFIAVCSLYACVTLLLAPAQQRAAQLRASVRDLTQQAAQRTQLAEQHAAISRTLAQARSHLDTLSQAASTTASINEIFAQLSALAHTHNIKVISLTPTDNRHAPHSHTEPQLIQTQPFSMTFSSTYTDATAFMDALERHLLLTTLRTVRIEPVSDQSGQGVRVSLTACSFHVTPDTLAHAIDAAHEAAFGQLAPQTIAATPNTQGGQP